MLDAVVIGGGPAGAAAAIRLARAGKRVRLYERATFPRAKLCGGFLSPEALEDLDDLGVLHALQNSGAMPIRRSVIVSSQDTRVESNLPEAALSTSRAVLDQLLLEQARAAGAEIIVGQDGFRIPDARDITVIAAGRLSDASHLLRRKRLSPWYAGSETRYVGIQAFFEGVHDVSDQVELDIVKSGYVGLVRQQEGINLCALTTQETMQQFGPSVDEVLRQFISENPALRRHLAGAARKSDWMTVGPVRLGIRRLSAERTFYIGDAACVVDPFAGEGMAMGLYGAQLLMKALAQKNPEKAYEQFWHQAFDPALQWNAVMRAFYSLTLFREPILQALRTFPVGIQWMTELTRYRRLESGLAIETQ